MSFSITSVVSNTFCPAITTGIVIRLMEWQIFPLPNLNMVSLRSRLILSSSSELKKSLTKFYCRLFVHPESKTAVLSVSSINVSMMFVSSLIFIWFSYESALDFVQWCIDPQTLNLVISSSLLWGLTILQWLLWFPLSLLLVLYLLFPLNLGLYCLE